MDFKVTVWLMSDVACIESFPKIVVEYVVFFCIELVYNMDLMQGKFLK